MTASARTPRLAPAGGGWARLALATLDLAWALPGLGLIVVLLGGDGLRTALVLAVLYPAGLLATEVATILPGRARWRRVLVVALGAPAVVLAGWAAAYAPAPPWDGALVGAVLVAVGGSRLGLTAGVVVLLAGPFLFGRGCWLAGRTVVYTNAGASFQVGLGAVALGAMLGGGAHAAFAFAWALGFLGTGLAALAVTRGFEAGLAATPAARLWALIFTAVLLLAAFMLVAYGGAIAATLYDLATRLLNAMAAAAGALFAWLVSLFPPDPRSLPPEAPPPAPGGERSGFADLFTIPEVVRRLGGMAVFVGLAVPLVIGLVRFLAEAWRRLWDPVFMAGVSVERLEWRSAGPAEWLRWLLLRAGRLLWRGAGGRALDGDPRGWPVRLAYRDLLKAGQKHGAVRRPGQTAAEHLNQLAAAFPDHGEELALVTRAYERARYGPLPDGSERGEGQRVRDLCRQVTRHSWWARRGRAPRNPRSPMA